MAFCSDSLYIKSIWFTKNGSPNFDCKITPAELGSCTNEYNLEIEVKKAMDVNVDYYISSSIKGNDIFWFQVTVMKATLLKGKTKAKFYSIYTLTFGYSLCKWYQDTKYKGKTLYEAKESVIWDRLSTSLCIDDQGSLKIYSISPNIALKWK